MVKTGAIIIIVLILVAIVLGFIFLFSGDDSTTQEEDPSNLPPADQSGGINPPDDLNPIPEPQVPDDFEFPPSSDEPDVEATNPITHTVEVNNAGFSPKSLEINKGDTVIFTNVGTRDIWPASNVHPSHTIYPGSNIGKCNTDPSGIFDACTAIFPDGSFSFTFDEVGTWRYHDHRRSGNGGTIIVN